jgi:4-hydroxy 2-oxovalerate aldolase
MNFRILDCTLRDGGYLNNWDFSKEEIISIVTALEENNIEEIEISYLSKIKNVKTLLDNLTNNSNYLFMVNFSELSFLKIKEDLNIRIAIKKNQLKNLKNYLNISKNLYIQLMYINYYSTKEILEFIDICNNSDNIKALYIVDSFGSLLPKDIYNYYMLIDKNLKRDISIGLHLHNNNGLALLNMNKVLTNKSNRNLIVDSTLSGLGRGGGNINTESLLICRNKINLRKLLEIYENILIKKFKNVNLRMKVIQFLTGIYSVHQKYSEKFFNSKFSLIQIDDILKNLTKEQKINFDSSIFDS